MRERDYLIVANLARVRAAMAVLHQVIPGERRLCGITRAELSRAYRHVQGLEQRLAKRCPNTTEDP